VSQHNTPTPTHRFDRREEASWNRFQLAYSQLSCADADERLRLTILISGVVFSEKKRKVQNLVA